MQQAGQHYRYTREVFDWLIGSSGVGYSPAVGEISQSRGIEPLFYCVSQIAIPTCVAGKGIARKKADLSNSKGWGLWSCDWANAIVKIGRAGKWLSKSKTMAGASPKKICRESSVRS